MIKEIEITPFSKIKTDKQETIDKAIAEGFTVTDIPVNTNDYKEDGSDRPENIAKAKAEIDRKVSQDKIDEEENRPNLISNLLDNPLNKMNEQALKILPYDQLAEHFNYTVNTPNRLKAEEKARRALDEV